MLRVPALAGVRPLRLDTDAPEGTSAGILGFPENGPYHVTAGRLGHTATVVTQDAYGQRAGSARDHVPARPRPARQLGRPDGRRRRAEW